jgi:hypothetical protein
MKLKLLAPYFVQVELSMKVYTLIHRLIYHQCVPVWVRSFTRRRKSMEAQSVLEDEQQASSYKPEMGIQALHVRK